MCEPHAPGVSGVSGKIRVPVPHVIGRDSGETGLHGAGIRQRCGNPGTLILEIVVHPTVKERRTVAPEGLIKPGIVEFKVMIKEFKEGLKPKLAHLNEIKEKYHQHPFTSHVKDFHRFLSEAYQARDILYYDLNEYPPVDTATLTPFQVSPGNVGDLISFDATSSGGGPSHEYQLLIYSYNGDATWRVVDGYKTSTTLTWDTTGEVSGSYLVQLRVRNVGSSELYEARAFLSYSLN